MKLLLTLLLALTFAQSVLAGPMGTVGDRELVAQAGRQLRDNRNDRPPQRDVRPPERPPERQPRGDGRLSDEERRELHKDLEQANREIYKGQRQR